MKVGVPLIKSLVTPLGKSVLILLGLTAATSAADAGIHKDVLWFRTYDSETTTLILSNKEMEDKIKVKSLKEFSLLIGSSAKTIYGGIKRWISWYVIRYIRWEFFGKQVSKQMNHSDESRTKHSQGRRWGCPSW